MAHISEIDELFGNEPRYPLATMQQHFKNELEVQNQILNKTSSGIISEIKNSANSICGTLNNGFENLVSTNERGFSNVTNSIENLSEIAGWGFSQIIEQQRASNVLLSNIALLLKIPDIQKERQYYLEQGLKFFTNSKADKSLYEDALENLIKAENIEKTDYYVLQKIGVIYMFSTEHLNINKALEYFIKSAKYSLSETFSFSQQTLNYLENDVTKEFSEQLRTIFNVKNITITSFLLIARCYYIKKDYNNALLYANKAFDLNPNSIDAGYDRIKYLCKLNRIEEAINNLHKLISINRFITLKILTDSDIINHKKILDTLDVLKIETIDEVKSKMILANNLYVKDIGINNLLEEIKVLISKNNYLDAKLALDILTQKKEWKYIYFNENNRSLDRYFSDFKNNIKTASNIITVEKVEKTGLIEYIENLLIQEKYFSLFKSINREIDTSRTNRNKVSDEIDIAKTGIGMGLIFGIFIALAVGIIGLFYSINFFTSFIPTLILCAVIGYFIIKSSNK